MKILITGFTNRMCSEKSANHLYRSQGVMLHDELKAMGHDAEMRCVDCDEDLSCYDLAFVGIHPLSSITSGNFVEAARVIKECPAILYVEDWSIQRLGADWRGKLEGVGWLKNCEWRKLDPDNKHVRNARKILYDVLDSQWPLLAFMLNWGDHDLLLREADFPAQLLWLDPTPIVRIPVFNRVVEKHRTWVLATLGDHDKWVRRYLGTSHWDIYYLGKGGAKVKEEQVVQTYANCWGIACPGYKLAGSGWWRVRFNYAPRTGSILLTDEADVKVMSEAFQITASMAEERDPRDLRNLAELQREWHDSVAWSLEQFRDELSGMLARHGRVKITKSEVPG